MSGPFEVNYSDLRFLGIGESVNFFHNYPRFRGGNVMTGSKDYFVGIGLAALPYVAVGFVLFLVGFVLIYVRYYCCSAKFDKKEEKLNRMFSTTGKRLWQILLSLLCFLMVAIGLGLCFISNYSLSKAINNIITIIMGFVELIYAVSEIFVDITNNLLDRAQTVNIDEIPFELLQPYTDVLNALQNSTYVAEGYLNEFASITNQAWDIINFTQKAVKWLFLGLALIILLVAMGPLMIYSLSTSKGKCSRGCFALCFFIPMIIAWVCTGVITSVGCGLGDVCNAAYMLQQSLASTMNIVNIPPEVTFQFNPNNFFYERGIQCPVISSYDVYDELQNMFEDVQDIEVIQFILNATGAGFFDTGEIKRFGISLLDEVTDLVGCATLVNLITSGGNSACGSSATSVITSAYLAWIGFLLVAIGLTLMFLFSLFGFDMADFANSSIFDLGYFKFRLKQLELDSDDEEEEQKTALEAVGTKGYEPNGNYYGGSPDEWMAAPAAPIPDDDLHEDKNTPY